MGGRSGSPDCGGGGRLHVDPSIELGTHRLDRQHTPRDHRRLRARPPGQVGREGMARPLDAYAEHSRVPVLARDLGHDRAQCLCTTRLFRPDADFNGSDADAYLRRAAVAVAIFAACCNPQRRRRMGRYDHRISADIAGLRRSTLVSATATLDCSVLCCGDCRLGGAVLARPWRLLEGPVPGRRARQHLTSMQLAGQRGDGVVDQRSTAPLVERGGNYLASGRYRDIDSDSPDFGKRLGLLLCDPLLGEELPSVRALFEITHRLRSDPLRRGSGVRDDRFRFCRRFTLLRLIFGEGPFRFLAQVRRRFQFRTDPRRARIETPDYRLPRSSPYHRHEYGCGDEDPELRIVEAIPHQLACSAIARSTAAAILVVSGAEPVILSVTASPTSIAIWWISDSARSFAAAMRSVVCLTTAWACARAVASAC